MKMIMSSGRLLLLLSTTSAWSSAWLPTYVKKTRPSFFKSFITRPRCKDDSSSPQNLKQQSTRKIIRSGIIVVSASLNGSNGHDAIDNSQRLQKQQQLVLYNTKARAKEPFTTMAPMQVKMYTCGPTVYDFAHIGNFRAFLTYDIVKRVLLYLGYYVDHVCNLTDVDDKIIQRANQENVKHVSDLTRRYEDFFFQDLQALNIVPARVYPRATEHIDDMVQMIQQLHSNGLAYQSLDGSWYFAVQKQPGYGQQLTNLNWDDLEATERNAVNENNDDEIVQKRFAYDFCLWKAYKPGVDRDDATWDTTIGRGRPGWHLECSAMARRYLGDTLDLHGGGQDLKFPHHENEIAQSQGVNNNNQPFCNCWIHNGFVQIGADKMSKSLGNFVTLRTACPTALDVRAYRYLVVSSHYRNPLAFTPTAMQAAKNALKRIDKVRKELTGVLSSSTSQHHMLSSGVVLHDKNNGNNEQFDAATCRLSISEFASEQVANFEAAILDDLSMPRAAASLFALVKKAEQELKNDKQHRDLVGLHAIQAVMNQMDQVFGIFYQPNNNRYNDDSDEQGGAIPQQVKSLVSQRNAAKEAKDWELADSLRARIIELGFAVKDVKGGEPIVSRIKS